MEVTVVGSCNVDLISYVSRLPKPGETIQGTKFSMGQGGKGANQCVMSAKLGAKTAMIAKVGQDTFGDNFIKAFQDVGVCTDFISRTDKVMTGVAPINVDDSDYISRTDQDHTGSGTISVDHTGQNSIIICPGANLLLNEDDLRAAEGVISTSKVMICQLEIEPSITLAALKMAREHGVRTILNPAPAISLEKAFFENSDIFCPNETESEILTGVSVKSIDDAKQAAASLRKLGCRDVIITLGEMGCLVAEFFTPHKINALENIVENEYFLLRMIKKGYGEILTGVSVKSVDDAKQAASSLRKLGCRDVIITLGEMGCLVAESNSDDPVHVAAPSVEAKDTTGAGDSFIGALAFYLATMPSLGLVESARRAVQIASVSVQREGTQTSMPVRSELPEKLFIV